MHTTRTYHREWNDDLSCAYIFNDLG